jgi:hypothetical protein
VTETVTDAVDFLEADLPLMFETYATVTGAGVAVGGTAVAVGCGTAVFVAVGGTAVLVAEGCAVLVAVPAGVAVGETDGSGVGVQLLGQVWAAAST